MARIRSVKPEVRTSLVVGSWPREVRYLWILLWGYLDDHGRGVDDPRLVKADCLPLDDDVSPAEVDRWLDIIASSPSKPLCRYSVEGCRYMHCPNWKEHQKPSHPADSRIPECPDHDQPPAKTPRKPRKKGSGEPREVLAKPSREAPPRAGAEQLVRAGSREQGSPSGSGARRRATRIPDDFAVTEDMIAWARQHTPDVGKVETDKFIDYWRSKSGQSATKLDWVATWRNWMRKAQEDSGKNRSQSGRLVPSRNSQIIAAARERWGLAEGGHI